MKAYPRNPPVDTMFMAVMAMVLPLKIVEDFQSFVKKKKIQNVDPHFRVCILQENGFKELTLVLFESLV
jgi:hypothetical protein